MSTPQLIALVVVCLGALTDLRTRRIPNWLTFGSAALALAFHTWSGGWHGLLEQGGAGWIVGVALFLPIFLLGGLGAGDVKLLGAAGAWVGPFEVLQCALASVIAGGVLALAVALRRRYLRQALRNVWMLLTFWRVMGVRPAPGLTIGDAPGPRLPYGVAIAAGTAVALFWK